MNTSLEQSYVQASVAKRFAATVIDYGLVSLFALALLLVTGLMESAESYIMPQPIIRGFSLLLVSYVTLNAYCLMQSGQTLGKRVMRIRIVSKEGEQVPALWRLILRAFALLLLACMPVITPALVVALLLNPLFCLSKSKRCLHDYIASTLVVDAGVRFM